MSEETVPILPTVEVQPEVDPLSGLILDGYQVKERMESGGMGLIYRAWHTGIERNAVVKVLKPEMATDAEQVARFHKEARTLGRLKHPNIIEIYGAGVLPDGRLYILTEFLEGQSLHRVMRTRSPMAPLEALGMIEQVLSGLTSAHEQGFIHRDLKPENIFVVPQPKGEPLLKLLDFGLAKQDAGPLALAGAVAPARSTLAGTPQYISPEQATGQSEKIGPASDLYSVGVIMFEMLAGHLPFRSTASGDREQVIELLKMHAQKPAPRLENEDVPHSLAELVERLLMKEPSERYDSAAQLKAAVRGISREIRQGMTDVRRMQLPQSAVNTSAGSVNVRPNNTDQIAGAVVAALGEAPAATQRRKLFALVVVLLLAPVALTAAWNSLGPGDTDDGVLAPKASMTRAPPQMVKVQVAAPAMGPAAPVALPEPEVPQKVLAVEEELAAPLKVHELKPVAVATVAARPKVKEKVVAAPAIANDDCESSADWRESVNGRLSQLQQRASARALKEPQFMANAESFFADLNAIGARVREAKTREDCARVNKEITDMAHKYNKEGL
ncbi:MAG: serine/threonine protein kinase [Myxococcaceae bacterium]|nr:serine/threonine protein kinase [Myxococcaceae bacterium]